MAYEKAARGSCHYARANKKTGTQGSRSIVTDWEQGTLVAGLLVGVCFGLMFLWAAVMF